MLPGVNMKQIFSLSFGNTTFVFPIIYILADLRWNKRHLDVSSRVHSAAPLQESLHGIFIGAFYASVLAISLFISPTSLWSSSDLRGNHGRSQVEKKGTEASVLLIAHGGLIGTAMTPINHLLWLPWRFTEYDRNHLTRNIWWLAFQPDSCSLSRCGVLRTVGEWIYQTRKYTQSRNSSCQIKKKRETATVFIFMGVKCIMGDQNS